MKYYQLDRKDLSEILNKTQKFSFKKNSFNKNSQKTPHNWPVRLRYGVFYEFKPRVPYHLCEARSEPFCMLYCIMLYWTSVYWKSKVYLLPKTPPFWFGYISGLWLRYVIGQTVRMQKCFLNKRWLWFLLINSWRPGKKDQSFTGISLL